MQPTVRSMRVAGAAVRSKAFPQLQAVRSFSDSGAGAAVRELQASIPPEAWNQKPTKVTRLANGVRVASQETLTENVSVGVHFDAGCRHETESTNGVAHFLEHIAFRGTQKKNMDVLETEAENMGLKLQSHIGREVSSYTARGQRGDLKAAIATLSDCAMRPSLDAKKLAEDKATAVHILENVPHSIDQVLFDRMHQSCFRDCAMGHALVGPPDDLKLLTKETVEQHIATNYTADRLVVSAAGAVNHEELVAAVQASFGDLKPATSRRPGVEKPYFLGSDLMFRNDDMGRFAHFVVAWQGVPHSHPDAAAMMVMQSIIGSYKRDSSYIPDVISGNRTINAIANRQDVGCAEEFQCFNVNYKDTGLFGWYAKCDEVAVEHCMGELMFNTIAMAFTLTEEEVVRAKRELITKIAGSFATCQATQEDIGRQMLSLDRRLPLAELLARIDAVDVEEVKRVTWTHLHDNEVTACGLGPIHGMPHYHIIRFMTYWHRY